MNLFDKKYLQIKSTNKLWALEKERFRPVIILSLLTFFLALACALTSTILLATFKDNLAEYIVKINGGTTPGFRPEDQIMSMIITNGLVTVGMLVSIIVFLVFYARTFKEKSLANMHTWPSMVLIISWFINLFSIIRNIRSLATAYNPIILSITIVTSVITVVLIVFQFLFVSQLRYFKGVFINARRLEEIKQLQKKMKESGMMDESNLSNNLFGIMLDDVDDVSANQDKNKFNKEEDIEEAEIVDNKAHLKNNEKENEEKIKKLLALPNAKLYNIAETLYISGYKKMDKEELCRLIVQIVDTQKAKEDEEANKDKK